MLIARKLRKESIAEYLIYMWQIEDLIRANNLSIDKIEVSISKQYNQSADVQKEITEWYESLIEMMQAEGVQNKGHLAMNNNTISLLTDLHLRLLKSNQHTDYSAAYYKALPYIVELRSKSDNVEIPELETCFSALYGLMLMKIEGKEITQETQSAINQISNLLRLLSIKFHKEQEHQLEF